MHSTISVAALLLFGTSALVQAASMHSGRAACATDVETHCSEVKRGQGRVVACLRANEDKLTAECRRAINAVRDACEKDIAAHCEEVTAGGGRILRCLREHKSELSDDCQEAIKGRRGAS